MARAKVSNNFSSYMNTNDDIIKRTMRNDGIRLFALIIDLSFIFIQRILTIILWYETTIIIPQIVAKRWMAWPPTFLETSLLSIVVLLFFAWNIDWCKGNQLSHGFGNVENKPIVLVDTTYVGWYVWARNLWKNVLHSDWSEVKKN